jgi:hypothetical protein
MTKTTRIMTTQSHSPLPEGFLLASRSWNNESEAKEMHGCYAPGGNVTAYFPTENAFNRAISAVNSHAALVEALTDAEFLLRNLSINWKEAGAMKDSCARSAESAREALKLAGSFPPTHLGILALAKGGNE